MRSRKAITGMSGYQVHSSDPAALLTRKFYMVPDRSQPAATALSLKGMTKFVLLGVQVDLTVFRRIYYDGDILGYLYTIAH